MVAYRVNARYNRSFVSIKLGRSATRVLVENLHFPLENKKPGGLSNKKAKRVSSNFGPLFILQGKLQW